MASAASGSFDEIRALFGAIPGPDLAASTAAAARAETLGEAGGLYRWLASWQGRAAPRLERPRLCLFAAAHGLAVHARSAGTAAAAAAQVQAIIDGAAPVHRLAAALDADLRAYDMAIEAPTPDATRAAAADEGECVRDLAYGMMSVDPGIDLLGLGAFGAGGRVAAAAILAGLDGSDTAAWLEDADEAAVAARALARHGGAGDPLALLAGLAGREIAAVAGAVIAARLARTPVVLDGVAACAGAAVVQALDRRAADHCVLARAGATASERRLADRLGLPALLGPAVGDGPGVPAALSVFLLRDLVGVAAPG